MKPCSVWMQMVLLLFFGDAGVTMLLLSCIFSAREETLAILEKHSLVEEAPVI